MEEAKMESGRDQHHNSGGRDAFYRSPHTSYSSLVYLSYQLPHHPVPSIPRGGANTSDHVDILGSTGLNEIILKVVTGVGHEVEDNYVSNIREYAQKIQWD